MSAELLLGLIVLGALVGTGLFVSMLFRRVVSTNEVHIVQSSKSTKSYGKDTGNGNTYYELPSWIPLFGITKVILPVSVFNLELKSYEAYDKGRLPFVVDIMAFFRISDSNLAASRVASFEELNEQLTAVVQGAARTILANNDIEEIMQGRSKFGEQFTNEVREQLSHWGVEAVKNIELMDIRDSGGSNVIKNIMEKKKSQIEMESRTEVAKNLKTAQIAELEASKEVQLQKQSNEEIIGVRTIEAQRKVEISKQEAHQSIKEQEKLTKEKEMSVLQVQSTRTAEIEKQVKVVQAQQVKETDIILADGQLESKRREAESIRLQGEAKAKAEQSMLMAPVDAQITLAKEIGNNENYQKYLVTLEQVKAAASVGIEQAKALANADIKVITNSEKPGTGLTDVMDLFSSKGGIQVGAMLDGLAATETGKKLVSKIK